MRKFNFIIPAAGSGRRLRPITSAIPKSLIEINKKPIIGHQLDNLPKNFINRVVIILGYKGNQIKDYVNSLDLNYPVIFLKNDKYAYTNCAYSFMRARDYMSGSLVLINCDLLFKKDNVLKLCITEKKNVINVRKIGNSKTDLQDVIIEKSKITSWALNIPGANAEVMGPIKLCPPDAKKIIRHFDSLSELAKEQLQCFSLFSKLIKIIDYNTVFVDDTSWMEIDTEYDLKKARLVWGR